MYLRNVKTKTTMKYQTIISTLLHVLGGIMLKAWANNYQKAYHLQEVISHIAVDEKRNCIYATYTPKGEDPMLLKYDIH